MSNSNSRRREIIELEEFPRSSTPEPAPKRQRTIRKASGSSINNSTERPRVTRSARTVESAEPPQANGSVGRSNDPQRHRSEGVVERAEPPQANGSVGRSSDPPRDRSATPEVDPEEAANEDSSSRVNGSAERLRQPEDRTLMATSRLLSAVPTSTEGDTEALPMMDLEQAAWDASVMLVSTGTDTDGNAMAVVSVPGDEADGPTSTGEGAAGTTRTRTTENDEGAASEQENSSSRLISVEASFDIVGGQPRTGTAELSRANGSSAGAMGSSETNSEPIDGTVAAASGGQVANSLGQCRAPVVWGQGIPLRPTMSIQRSGSAKKHQAVQTTSQLSGMQTGILSNILPAHASV